MLHQVVFVSSHVHLYGVTVLGGGDLTKEVGSNQMSSSHIYT